MDCRVKPGNDGLGSSEASVEITTLVSEQAMGWFKKKVELQITDENGKSRTVKVTKRQFDQWIAEGKIRQVDGCTVHIIDPMGDRTEYWKIGTHVTREIYDKFKDSDGDLYAMVNYVAGKPDMHIITKQVWRNLQNHLKDIGL